MIKNASVLAKDPFTVYFPNSRLEEYNHPFFMHRIRVTGSVHMEISDLSMEADNMPWFHCWRACRPCAVINGTTFK
jgi:hypothetical protein